MAAAGEAEGGQPMFAFTLFDVIIAFGVAGVAVTIAVYEDGLNRLFR